MPLPFIFELITVTKGIMNIKKEEKITIKLWKLKINPKYL